jgi:hypothetical protein
MTFLNGNRRGNPCCAFIEIKRKQKLYMAIYITTGGTAMLSCQALGSALLYVYREENFLEIHTSISTWIHVMS